MLAFTFPLCVQSGQGKPILWVYFELKLAELFVSSEAHTDAFKTIFVLENLLFVFSLVSAHFLQVITLKWFAERDSYRSRPPAQPSSGDWEMAVTPDSHISCLGMSSGK